MLNKTTDKNCNFNQETQVNLLPSEQILKLGIGKQSQSQRVYLDPKFRLKFLTK